MRQGHYVASARVDVVGGETTGKCWMSFDDERVRLVESPASAESTPKDWYFAVFEYAPDSGETVADAAFPARAAAPTKTKGREAEGPSAGSARPSQALSSSKRSATRATPCSRSPETTAYRFRS